ncbi:flagellar motor protein MotB [Aquibacillus albus]|uniref:Chemotaxis protein MotB n=1 Tax=Aquibacillus albus TaxID=1168171 RepID=A0ABS2N5Z1_9BACI|nr:flagellar motor protein MotB [Aquibacillus albus]MBM7573526.1 chemotaxis protein MotB [Aquibacillus albus]
MRRKRGIEEEKTDESWLIPYADMLTLLLALFVVLFAMSEIDAKKYEELSNFFRNELATGPTGDGILEADESVVDVVTEVNREPKEIIDEEKSERELNQLKQLQQEINTYIERNNLSTILGTKLMDEGLLISIYNELFFDSGSATVKGEGEQVAQEISELLYTDPPHQIVISGHTDNVPIRNGRFASNWDLSVMRAVNFMRLLLDNEKLDPQRFSAKGYGEHQPILPNNSEENRAKNRRVEVLILPNYQIDSES